MVEIWAAVFTAAIIYSIVVTVASNRKQAK